MYKKTYLFSLYILYCFLLPYVTVAYASILSESQVHMIQSHISQDTGSFPQVFPQAHAMIPQTVSFDTCTF